MAASKAFLDHFQPEHRGAIGNWFVEAVRQGADTPRAVCSAVFRLVSERIRLYGDATGGVDRRGVLRSLREDRVGALALAEHFLWYECLPAAERARVKQESTEAGKREWMRSQPPTEKQAALLARLGYDGPIENRAAASDLIERLKDW